MSSNFVAWVSEFSIPSLPLIHAGAHYGEERFTYSDLAFQPVYWIEAHPSVAKICFENISSFPNHYLIVAAVSEDINQEVTFYVAGEEDSSSSILEPNLISASHPKVTVTEKLTLTTTTLDGLHASGVLGRHDSYGLILDLQGAEVKAIKGGLKLLQDVSFIIAEVSTRELYKGGAKFIELSELLNEYGFSLFASEINRGTGWGEAIFVNRAGSCSKMLELGFQGNVIKGKFSFGTFFRSFLLILKVPRKYLKHFARK
jgi:FkbM family methyltransferase